MLRRQPTQLHDLAVDRIHRLKVTDLALELLVLLAQRIDLLPKLVALLRSRLELGELGAQAGRLTDGFDPVLLRAVQLPFEIVGRARLLGKRLGGLGGWLPPRLSELLADLA